MTETLQNERLQYLYFELEEERAAQLEIQRALDADCDKELRQWEGFLRKLDQAIEEPSKQSIDRILAYSNSKRSSAVH